MLPIRKADHARHRRNEHPVEHGHRGVAHRRVSRAEDRVKVERVRREEGRRLEVGVDHLEHIEHLARLELAQAHRQRHDVVQHKAADHRQNYLDALVLFADRVHHLHRRIDGHQNEHIVAEQQREGEEHPARDVILFVQRDQRVDDERDRDRLIAAVESAQSEEHRHRRIQPAHADSRAAVGQLAERKRRHREQREHVGDDHRDAHEQSHAHRTALDPHRAAQHSEQPKHIHRAERLIGIGGIRKRVHQSAARTYPRRDRRKRVDLAAHAVAEHADHKPDDKRDHDRKDERDKRLVRHRDYLAVLLSFQSDRIRVLGRHHLAQHEIEPEHERDREDRKQRHRRDRAAVAVRIVGVVLHHSERHAFGNGVDRLKRNVVKAHGAVRRRTVLPHADKQRRLARYAAGEVVLHRLEALGHLGDVDTALVVVLENADDKAVPGGRGDRPHIDICAETIDLVLDQIHRLRDVDARRPCRRHLNHAVARTERGVEFVRTGARRRSERYALARAGRLDPALHVAAVKRLKAAVVHDLDIVLFVAAASRKHRHRQYDDEHNRDRKHSSLHNCSPDSDFILADSHLL